MIGDNRIKPTPIGNNLFFQLNYLYEHCEQLWEIFCESIGLIGLLPVHVIPILKLNRPNVSPTNLLKLIVSRNRQFLINFIHTHFIGNYSDIHI